MLQGKAALPYPKPDFWAAANAHTNGTLMIHDSPGVDTILEDPPYFLPCSSGRCLGNFQCQPGYTGVQCSVCEPGQFFFQGKCDIPCADIEPSAVVTVFGIGAVVCVWLILNFVPSKSAHLRSLRSPRGRVRATCSLPSERLHRSGFGCRVPQAAIPECRRDVRRCSGQSAPRLPSFLSACECTALSVDLRQLPGLLQVLSNDGDCLRL